MSEQQPLLCTHRPSLDVGTLARKSTYPKYRERTASFLEHPTLHRVVIALIAIDAVCVLADLGYTVLSPECAVPGEEDTPGWLDILSFLSLTITTLFLIEIPLTLWSLGVQFMNPFSNVPHATWHLFDAIIILTTFVLEVGLRGKERELAGLLVILRLWRLVKLVGGVAVGAAEVNETTARELAEVRSELEQTRVELSQLRELNHTLRENLNQLKP